MGAREISFFSGTLGQAVANDTVEANIPIATNARRAIQVYGVRFVLDGSLFYTEVAANYFTMGLQSRNKDDTKTKYLAVWNFANLGAAPVGRNDLAFVWTAPPGLILADDHLKVIVESGGFAGGQSMFYQVYYKPIAITDIQAVQLQLV